MAKKKIKSNEINLDKIIGEILEGYTDEIAAEVSKAIPRIANETVNEIESLAPHRETNSKHYNQSWEVELQHPTRLETSAIIYSTQPGLPHLLEFGHALKNGGRTKAFPHIAVAEENAVKNFEKKVEEVIHNASQ